MAITVRVLTDEEGFAQLGPQWSELLGATADGNTFLSHEWLYNWWAAYRPAAELRILLAEREGRLVGIAPLMLERTRRLGAPIRVLRFLGDGTFETDHMGWLIDRDEEPAVREALHEALAALEWDAAELNQTPEGSPHTAGLLRFAERRGWRTAVEAVPCPRRTLPESYEALLASLPSRFRTGLRSSRKKLQQEHCVEFGLHERPEELPEALDALFANHASRWQAKGQQGVFVDPRKRDFYARLTPALLARGWLRFFYLKVDGRIVAQEYCFEHDGTVMLLQEGFDYAWAGKNVGNTLRGFVFEHLIEKGAKVYDFLAGASRHKEIWSNEAPNDLLIQLSRGARGALYALPPQALAAIKNRLGGPAGTLGRLMLGRWNA